jgi:crotonobetainyl-CoA:carnitine CoA-transferase CaiB-like acyl-CoA transferase
VPGPLNGIRIVEVAGLGPVPFAGMMLADHGAEVVGVERPSTASAPNDPFLRSRKPMTLDLKCASGKAKLRPLCRRSDGLIARWARYQLHRHVADSNEAGHLFQSDRGHRSNLMAAT